MNYSKRLGGSGKNYTVARYNGTLETQHAGLVYPLGFRRSLRHALSVVFASVDTKLILLIFGAVLVITIAAILWTLGHRRRRTQRLSAISLQLGFSLEPDGKALLNEPIADLPLFALGRIGNCEILNLMRGRFNGYPVAIFDFHYWTGSGDDRSDYEQTIFCFQIASPSAPNFALRPKMSAFESRIEEIAAKFWKLELPQENSGTRWAVQKCGAWMAIWKKNFIVKPEDLPMAVQEAFSACELFRSVGAVHPQSTN